MILFGVYEEHDQVIQHYLQAANIPELYQKVIQRVKDDFDKTKPGMAELFLSYLALSRRGLNENDELLFLMEDKGLNYPKFLEVFDFCGF